MSTFRTADNSGIPDSESLEKFITLEELMEEANKLKSLGILEPAHLDAANIDEIIELLGQKWWALLLSVTDATIKENTLEPIRFGYNNSITLPIEQIFSGQDGDDQSSIENVSGNNNENAALVYAKIVSSSVNFSWSESDIFDITAKIARKRFLNHNRTHLGILEKVGSVRNVVGMMKSPQCCLNWIQSLQIPSVNYNAVNLIDQLLEINHNFELSSDLRPGHDDYERVVTEATQILKAVKQSWPEKDGYTSKGKPRQQVPTVFRQKDLIVACSKLIEISPKISRRVLFEALEEVLPTRMGTYAWYRQNSFSTEPEGRLAKSWSSDHGRSNNSDLLKAAEALEGRLENMEDRVLVLATAYQAAGEPISDVGLKSLASSLGDHQSVRERLANCQTIVEEICTEFELEIEDLHAYLYECNFPNPVKPL